MNLTDNTSIPAELMDRQRVQNDGNASSTTAIGSELMSYQPSQQTIDFTDFLNLEDDQLATGMNAPGSLQNQTDTQKQCF